MADHNWVDVFTREFEQPESAVQARIWADVLGDEYPAELAPYSCTTRSELLPTAGALAVGSGDLLVDVGLDVEVYDENADWSQRQRAISERLLASVDELVIESGEDPVVLRQGLEEMAATQDAMSRRVFIVARRR